MEYNRQQEDVLEAGETGKHTLLSRWMDSWMHRWMDDMSATYLYIITDQVHLCMVTISPDGVQGVELVCRFLRSQSSQTRPTRPTVVCRMRCETPTPPPPPIPHPPTHKSHTLIMSPTLS